MGVCLGGYKDVYELQVQAPKPWVVDRLSTHFPDSIIGKTYEGHPCIELDRHRQLVAISHPNSLQVQIISNRPIALRMLPDRFGAYLAQVFTRENEIGEQGEDPNRVAE